MSNGAADLPAEVALPEVTNPSTPDKDPLSIKVTLADLCAKGTSQYAIKNYSEAMDYYAQASELQAELNGEMAPENAEILFLYGRCLYKVGQSKSDVLGGKSGGEKKKSKSKGTAKPKAAELEPVIEDDEDVEKAVEAIVEQSQSSSSEPKAAENGVPKPFFQFTGDENFEESEEEEEEEGEEDEEDEDELLLGFEVLDLARVLFERRLQQPEEEDEDSKGKGTVTEDSSLIKHLKERVADTHDLLGDISLENERFPNAISDFRASLAYKQQLYPKGSEILAEAHFKLSLALEFGSITTTSDADDSSEQKENAEEHINEEMRAEAVEQLELAIESTKLKLHNKEVSLAETSSPEENDTTRAQIADVKEMLVEMEQRLLDLRAPAVDIQAVLDQSIGGPNGAGSIAGSKEGETRAETEARIEEAKKNANNIQGVTRKKAPKVEAGSVELPLNGKRKAEDEVTGESKKTKVDEAT